MQVESDTKQLINRLMESEGIHAFVLISEAADKYLPIIDSLTVRLANDQQVKATALQPEVAQKVDETRRTLKREDRIMWALRFYKKALIEELLWMVINEPKFFIKKAGFPASVEQPQLNRQLQKLADVDLAPFQESDPDDLESISPAYTGYGVIDGINATLGQYLKIHESYGEHEPHNPINRLRLQRQPFGEVIYFYRRGAVELMRRYGAAIEIVPQPRQQAARGGSFSDMRDKEGPLETIVQFPNGWRWFNLHRNCSEIRSDPGVHGPRAITGHCANTAAKGDVECLELAEPLGGNRWRHHALFILHRDGTLGEMKGRENQKPSHRLHKYIFGLLRQYSQIKGLEGEGYNASNNFYLKELPRPYLEQLAAARPELWRNSAENQLPEEPDPRPALPGGAAQGRPIPGQIGPGQPA